MFKFSKSLLVAAVVCLTPLAIHATPVPVSTNPSLSIGGLNFGNFSCSITKGGSLAEPDDCSQINVDTVTMPGVGIEFSSGFTAGPLSFDDAVIKYGVSSASGIHSVGLDFDGSFLGLAISSVIETVWSNGHIVGQATVACDTFSCNQSDTIALNGSYNDLYIWKDINVSAGRRSDAQASIIDQTFGTDAPEPASLALFGGGLLGVALLLRKRVKSGDVRKAASLA